jgi:hypothetical protein
MGRAAPDMGIQVYIWGGVRARPALSCSGWARRGRAQDVARSRVESRGRRVHHRRVLCRLSADRRVGGTLAADSACEARTQAAQTSGVQTSGVPTGVTPKEENCCCVRHAVHRLEGVRPLPGREEEPRKARGRVVRRHVRMLRIHHAAQAECIPGSCRCVVLRRAVMRTEAWRFVFLTGTRLCLVP